VPISRHYIKKMVTEEVHVPEQASNDERSAAVLQIFQLGIAVED
jgi:hypothetical protein